MELLHRTETLFTFKEAKKFTLSLTYTRKKKKYLLALNILIIVLSLLLLLFGDPLLPISLILLTFLINIVPNPLIYFVAKREFESNKGFKNKKIIYEFYGNHLKIQHDMNNEVIINKRSYNDFFEIIETPTNFYLMWSKSTGTIIIKENCSQELIYFLQHKQRKLTKNEI